MANNNILNIVRLQYRKSKYFMFQLSFVRFDLIKFEEKKMLNVNIGDRI